MRLGELSRLWFGDFVLLWGPGVPDVKTLCVGMHCDDAKRHHRLNVDGIAGIQTLVVLDTALATPGSPLLDAAPRLAQGG